MLARALRRRVDLVLAGADRLDDLALEGLVAEELEALGDGVLVTDERLLLGHDGPHLRGDPLEVLVGEVGAARELEVVVEAVLDDRADGEVGPRPQPEHGLGQHVGRRVAQHLPTERGGAGHHGHLGAVGQHGGQVDRHAVEGGGHRRLGQAGTDRLGELQGGRSRLELLGAAIGESDGHGCHGGAFRCGARRGARAAGWVRSSVGGRSGPTGADAAGDTATG